jgi:competence protein ComEC
MLLLYDPSFQLSFLATLGLIILAPKIQSWFKSENYILKNLQSVFAATISAQVFVFPLIVYMMGTISLISPLVNILILLLIPISMIYGLITTIMSFLWFDFSQLLSYLNFLVLRYDLNTISFFANFEYSTLEITNFGAYWLFSIYIAYILIYLWQKKE